jgi:predicted helicase
MNKALYDAYIKAFRWSSDRLDPEHGGVIAFVSNGAWLDGNSTAGFRKCLVKEFSATYVFNLRGNQRTSGELSRKEGGKIFGSGSRASIAITLLIKNPKHAGKKTVIHYHDIGDYLNREDKLGIVQKYATVANAVMKWRKLLPNEQGDWLNQRNDLYETFIEIGSKKKIKEQIFTINSNGVVSNRDAWVYNFSKESLVKSMKNTVTFYNQQLEAYKDASKNNPKLKLEEFIDTNPKNISWTRSLKQAFGSFKKRDFKHRAIVTGIYRPFMKQHFYFERDFNECVYQQPKIYPKQKIKNRVICMAGVGANKNFSILITNIVPCLDTIEKAQCFPLYYYEETQQQTLSLFDTETSQYTRRDGVSDFILNRAKKQYGKIVTKEDIFYYVYGFLHSPEYRTAFANDLKKMLPRLPLVDNVKDFWNFSKAGRALAELHINYESVPAYPDVTVKGADSGYYTVKKMKFPKKGQKDTIIYNSKITIENIPAKAYEYVVNGKSAIEWIMDRYRVTVHKASGIKNDPNDWAEEVGNPRYILDLLLSIINVSVQTVDIVAGLPKVEFE